MTRRAVVRKADLRRAVEVAREMGLPAVMVGPVVVFVDHSALPLIPGPPAAHTGTAAEVEENEWDEVLRCPSTCHS